MKTSNKILLITMGIILGFILAGLIISKSMIFSAATQGDGNKVEMQRQVEDFTRIKVNGNYKVNFTQDDNRTVMVIADENLMEFISTDVSGNELVIRSSQPIRPSSEILVEVKAPVLERVESNASARFYSQGNLSQDEIYLLSNAGALIDIEGVFRHVDAHQNAGALIVLIGTTDTFKATSNAGGTIDATGLEAQSAIVEANAGADIRLNTQKLEASANAGGSIRYIGNPIIEAVNTNAGGSISKLR